MINDDNFSELIHDPNVNLVKPETFYRRQDPGLDTLTPTLRTAKFEELQKKLQKRRYVCINEFHIVNIFQGSPLSCIDKKVWSKIHIPKRKPPKNVEEQKKLKVFFSHFLVLL